jgi:hypothetical protein
MASIVRYWPLVRSALPRRPAEALLLSLSGALLGGCIAWLLFDDYG